MLPRTRALATDVQQSLLALSDKNLVETLRYWLTFLQVEVERHVTLEEVCKSLGCRVHSTTTGQDYASLSELGQAEPEGEEISWVLPDTQMLREHLSKMPLKQFYHQVIGLAGDVFSKKNWAVYWGEPPSQQCNGASFMTSLTHYLYFKKGADSLSTEQFEAWYREILGIIEQTDLSAVEQEDIVADVYPYGRQWHFRVEFILASGKSSHHLVELLQRDGCTMALEETGTTIDGFREYASWRKEDLKAIAHVRRLLNRWQREGDIRWSQWKVKPARHQSAYRGKRQPKTTRHSRSSRKKQ